MNVIEAIRPDIQAMRAYAIAHAPQDCIKLDAMESPYTYSEELKAELAKVLAEAPINLYPNPAESGLIEALRQAYEIDPAAEVVLGNGSDELIQFLTLLVAKPGAKMLAPEPSFVMYRHNCELFGVDYHGVALKPDFRLDKDAFLEAVRVHQPAIVFIAYPNNPTGGRFEHDDVQEIIDAAPGIVVIDEAYTAFASDSFMQQAGHCNKLVVLRTMSKIGFAGLRLGYAAGAPVVINELKKILPPYNMNQLSLAAAKFALQYMPFINENSSRLKAERERVRTALKAIEQIEDFPSEANFLTLRVPDAGVLFQTLKEHNILIKNLHGIHPLLSQCVRITIGLPEQNQALLEVIQKLYSE